MTFGKQRQRIWRKQTETSSTSGGRAFTIVITSPYAMVTQEPADGTYRIAIPIVESTDQIIVYSTSPQTTAFVQTPDDVVNLLSQGVPLTAFIDYRSIQDGGRKVALLNLSEAVDAGNFLTLVGTIASFQETDGLVQTGLNVQLLTPAFVIETEVGVLDAPLVNTQATTPATTSATTPATTSATTPATTSDTTSVTTPRLGVNYGTVDTSLLISPSNMNGVTIGEGTA